MLFTETISVTTAADGSATGYSAYTYNARVVLVKYVADGSVPFDNTVDLDFTGNTTGIAVLSKANVSAAATWFPDVAGVALNTTTNIMAWQVPIVNELLKLAVAQGGNAKKGSFVVVFDGIRLD